MLKKKLFLLFSKVVIVAISAVFVMNTAFAESELKVGAWLGTQPTDSGIKEFNQLQGRKLDIVHMFINWSTDFNFVRTYADPVYANGATLLITWEPWEYDTVKISNGNADSYIKKMASDIKAYGKEIWLRPLHEANGNWYPWGIGDSNINTSETYKAAFRHIVDIFRNQGATNVKWVFNVNCSNVGTNSTFTSHYPGDAYVDYASIDGYNWGTTQSWGSKWQTFDEIFSSSYAAIKPFNKPIFIGEWASTEIGGDKAKWITDSFNTIKNSYDKIFAVIWFSENKETDWRINSSTAALNSYKNAVKTTSISPTPTDRPSPSPTSTPTASGISEGRRCDFDNNGYVNIADVMEIAGSFNTTIGDAKYDAKYDLDNNNAINIGDILIVVKYFNKAV